MEAHWSHWRLKEGAPVLLAVPQVIAFAPQHDLAGRRVPNGEGVMCERSPGLPSLDSLSDDGLDRPRRIGSNPGEGDVETADAFRELPKPPPTHWPERRGRETRMRSRCLRVHPRDRDRGKRSPRLGSCRRAEAANVHRSRDLGPVEDTVVSADDLAAFGGAALVRRWCTGAPCIACSGAVPSARLAAARPGATAGIRCASDGHLPGSGA